MTKEARSVLNRLQREIDRAIVDLSDDDYLEVCDELEDHCRATAEARREELGDGR